MTQPTEGGKTPEQGFEPYQPEPFSPNTRPDSAPLDANAVRRFREELRLNRKEFAALLNISPATLRVWETPRDSRPSGPLLLRLLDLAKRNHYPLGIEDVYADAPVDEGKK